MARPKIKIRVGMGVACALAGGTTFISLPSCEAILTTVNPCATVFAFCDANDIDLLFADIPDFDLDPTCTIPLLQGCSEGNIFPDQRGGP